MNQPDNNLADAIKAIKNAILKSRYRAAVLVNREQLSLYYGIGRYISENSSLKNMRTFYEQWSIYIAEIEIDSNRQLSTGEIDITELVQDRQPTTGDLQNPKWGKHHLYYCCLTKEHRPP